MKEILIIWTVCYVICLFATEKSGYRALHETRKEAINRGYAEYVVDAEGSTEFKWKDANNIKKEMK